MGTLKKGLAAFVAKHGGHKPAAQAAKKLSSARKARAKAKKK